MMEIIKIDNDTATVRLYAIDVAALEYACESGVNSGHTYWGDVCLAHQGVFQALLIGLKVQETGARLVTWRAARGEMHTIPKVVDAFAAKRSRKILGAARAARQQPPTPPAAP